MAASVLYMSMSLDGYVAGPNETIDNGLGDGGDRLHDWAWVEGSSGPSGVPKPPPGVNGEVFAEAMATGAVVAGTGTFDPAGGWAGDHHDGVPIFLLTRSGSALDTEQWPLVTEVDDVVSAMTRAKEAAGDRNVLVHGVGTAQLALEEGVLDEIMIHLVPVLLGQGRRLFGERDPNHIELERVRVLEGEGGTTHLHYRVRR